MNPKITFFISIFFISPVLFAQGEKSIKGKIVIKDATRSGVFVLNIVNEKEAVSGADGVFCILAKLGDILIFHSPDLYSNRKEIEPEDFDAGEIQIEMMPKATILEEVEIRGDINAVSLGILSNPAKRYTPAERRLKTAGEFKPIHLLGLLGGSLPLDPIINAISGRTSALRKEVQIEKRELLLQKIDERFKQDFFIGQLHIPIEKVGEFKQYLIDNSEFRERLESENEFMLQFVIGKLATHYLNLTDFEEK